jgi:tetrahydromethanopterin S-methyltransferase subunit C
VYAWTFFFGFFLSSSDWLSACAAIERAVNVSSGVNFNKVKSKQVAKWIICLVFIITGCTHIHDPIHRYLIDDEAEHRTWCVVQYSSSLQTFDRVVNILHFSFPFAISCISALVIITATARMRSNVRKWQSYK